MNHPLSSALMPFGTKPDATGTMMDFDALYRDLIKPAIEEAGGIEWCQVSSLPSDSQAKPSQRSAEWTSCQRQDLALRAFPKDSDGVRSDCHEMASIWLRKALAKSAGKSGILR